MALARGAALASANAPLFTFSTAALAYALDPGTGEVSPRALAPTYLDVSASADWDENVLAYSALDDHADDQKSALRRRPLVAVGSLLAGIFAMVAGVLVVSRASERPSSAPLNNAHGSVATRAQAPAQGPSQPPSAQLPALTSPPGAPLPAVVSPAAPPPVAEQTPPATPVYRAPPPRAPAPRAPAPAPVPRAPAPAPVPRAPEPPRAVPPPPPPPAPAAPAQPPMTMYLRLPFVTVPIPLNPPPPPPPPPAPPPAP
jgi:hypothetical protein